MKYNILLIEDEMQICEVICDYLSAQESDIFHIECTHTGFCGMERIYEKYYDLILLDIMLPEIDGFKICKELRKKSDTPVIFITARGRETDKLYGYRLGCDDYIVKPFSLPVLHAKIKALINRSKGMVQAPVLETGDIMMEPSRYIVRCDGIEVDLSNKEYELLKYLMEHSGKLCTREELLENIWGYDFEGNERVVDNHIKKLRSKVDKENKYIKTIMKKGYRIKARKDNNH